MSFGRPVVGVDLGGTNVRAQSLYADGVAAGPRIENPSRAQDGLEHILDALIRTITAAADESEVEPAGVGLAIPGHVDDDHGVVRWSPNFGQEINGIFQCWRDVQIREPLVNALGIPVVMANDANAAALGEYRFGSGKGNANCLVLLTMGTGIGGGVVLGPQALMGKVDQPVLLLGGNKGGAELGHILIRQGGLDCNAGSYGALEAYCRRDAIISRAIHRFQRKQDSMIWDMVKGDLSLITPQIVAEAADAGDFQAQDIWREIGVALGAGIGTLINVFAPDVFAIGGQVSKAGRWVMEPAVNEARYIAIPSLFDDCRIVTAEKSDDAGILGGAAIALQSCV